MTSGVLRRLRAWAEESRARLRAVRLPDAMRDLPGWVVQMINMPVDIEHLFLDSPGDPDAADAWEPGDVAFLPDGGALVVGVPEDAGSRAQVECLWLRSGENGPRVGVVQGCLSDRLRSSTRLTAASAARWRLLLREELSREKTRLEGMLSSDAPPDIPGLRLLQSAMEQPCIEWDAPLDAEVPPLTGRQYALLLGTVQGCLRPERDASDTAAEEGALRLAVLLHNLGRLSELPHLLGTPQLRRMVGHPRCSFRPGDVVVPAANRKGATLPHNTSFVVMEVFSWSGDPILEVQGVVRTEDGWEIRSPYPTSLDPDCVTLWLRGEDARAWLASIAPGIAAAQRRRWTARLEAVVAALDLLDRLDGACAVGRRTGACKTAV